MAASPGPASALRGAVLALVAAAGAGLVLRTFVGGPLLGLAHGPLMLLAGLFAFRLAARREGGSFGVHGTARFATAAEVEAGFAGDGLIVGRDLESGALLRWAGEGHLLTLAPTRSGKGVGAVMPNLLDVARSVVVIDPKGESVLVTAAARRAMGPVHVLDPFGATGAPVSAYNPLTGLRAGDPDLADRAASIAEALTPDAGGGPEAFWNEEARALLAGLILQVVTAPEETDRSLGRVRAILTSGPTDWLGHLEAMRFSTGADGLVARAAARQLGKGDREAPAVVSTAQRHTHFLDGARMERALARSDFAFEDLAAGTMTVMLVLPPERLATHGRWLRLMIVEALRALARGGPSAPGRAPVLFLLDEFAALGRLDVLAQAFGLMAGYGVQLWPILQDLSQLRALYGQRASTFLANAGLIQVFNVADLETAQFVASALGAATVRYRTASRSRGARGGESRSVGEALARRDLLTPDEVMRLPKDRLLVLRPGERPALARKLRYYADPEFRGRFGAPPMAGRAPEGQRGG